MIDRLFADIDRARAEAGVDYAAGVKTIPLPLRPTGPAPHPVAARLGRLVLVVVLVSIAVQLITGIELRPLLVAALALPLLARVGALVSLLPADLYRPNGWRPIATRIGLLAWYLAITVWPVLVAITIPVLLIMRRRSVHNLVLWAMKWRELRRLQAGKPPTPPIGVGVR